ncbi:MAG: glutaredoxin family protein [Candidatus Aquicultorales bacterium]
MAKKYLSDNNIEFEEIDVSANPDKVGELVEASGQLGVPVIVVEDEVIIGFDKTHLDRALAA